MKEVNMTKERQLAHMSFQIKKTYDFMSKARSASRKFALKDDIEVPLSIQDTLLVQQTSEKIKKWSPEQKEQLESLLRKTLDEIFDKLVEFDKNVNKIRYPETK